MIILTDSGSSPTVTTPYGLFLLIFIITQRYRLCITLSLHMQDWRPKEIKVLVWSQTLSGDCPR